MRINVLLFAQTAELTGRSELTIELPDGATAGQAVKHVAQAHPGLAPLLSQIALAVDQSYCPPHTPLRDGQTLALIPPVSGG